MSTSKDRPDQAELACTNCSVRLLQPQSDGKSLKCYLCGQMHDVVPAGTADIAAQLAIARSPEELIRLHGDLARVKRELARVKRDMAGLKLALEASTDEN